MKRMSFNRLVTAFGLAYGGGRVKSVRGVSPRPFNFWLQAADKAGKEQDAILYEAGSAGHFQFEISADRPLVGTFTDLDGEVLNVTLLSAEPATEVKGDIETTFTSVEPRAAVNPQVLAVMQQMRLMEGQMRALQRAKAPAVKRQTPVSPAVPAAAPASAEPVAPEKKGGE